MSTTSHEIIDLDFHEYDTIEAMRYIISLCERDLVGGVVFGVAMKRGHQNLYAATGRLASNTVEAAGVSAILRDRITQPLLGCGSHMRHR